MALTILAGLTLYALLLGFYWTLCVAAARADEAMDKETER